jgi:hypothetical protein
MRLKVLEGPKRIGDLDMNEIFKIMQGWRKRAMGLSTKNKAVIFAHEIFE